ncbi:hypothetical protein G3M48_004295 [Beauveria asiatica]|uniref:Uncharacterized protein n=1 Tax=Beauveria asiatica TaxID=1069075 RepID=A0AAW0RTE7_9HYPO
MRIYMQPTEACKELRKARSIGVSSYLRSRIETTLRTTRDLPLLDQIEHHPYLQHANDYLPWLRGNGIQWRRSYVSNLRAIGTHDKVVQDNRDGSFSGLDDAERHCGGHDEDDDGKAERYAAAVEVKLTGEYEICRGRGEDMSLSEIVA